MGFQEMKRTAVVWWMPHGRKDNILAVFLVVVVLPPQVAQYKFITYRSASMVARSSCRVVRVNLSLLGSGEGSVMRGRS